MSPVPLAHCLTTGGRASVGRLAGLGGTVRDGSATERYEFLTRLRGAADRFSLVSADLLKPESFDLSGFDFPALISPGFDLSGFELVVDGDPRGTCACANVSRTMREMVALLGKLGFGGYKLPKASLDNTVGNLLVRVGSLFQPAGVRSSSGTNLGRHPTFDNSKVKTELGLEFRDMGPACEKPWRPWRSGGLSRPWLRVLTHRKSPGRLPWALVAFVVVGATGRCQQCRSWPRRRLGRSGRG